MKSIWILVLAVVFWAPATTEAQQWSSEQQEVWEFEKACWEARDLEKAMACFHQEFIGWGNMELPAATNKNDRRVMFRRGFETEDQVFLYLKPVEIRVHDSVAVVLYIAAGTRKNKATGEETAFTERWTDIVLKQGGRWAWIADHGNPVEDD